MRLGYLAATSLDHYCEALEARFRPPPSEALAKFTTNRYSVEDCRSRRSITEYLATLEAAAKACGLGPTSNDTQKFGLVIQAWMHLDLPLRETVDEPAQNTTLEQFAGTLLRKQHNWFDRFPPRGSYPRQPERSYHQPDRLYHQPDQRPTFQHRMQPPYQPPEHPSSYQQSRLTQFPYTQTAYSRQGTFSTQLPPFQFTQRPVQPLPTTAPNNWNAQRPGTAPNYPAGTPYQHRPLQYPSKVDSGQLNPSQNQGPRQPLAITAPPTGSSPQGQNTYGSFQRDNRPLGNFGQPPQRAYAANPSYQFEGPHPHEPSLDGSQPTPGSDQSDSIGYWVDRPSGEESQYNNPEEFHDELGQHEGPYDGMDPPDTTAYFVQTSSLESRPQVACKATAHSNSTVPQAPRNYSTTPAPLIHECRSCQLLFPSRTKLFKHLEIHRSHADDPPVSAQATSVTTEDATDLPEKVSSAPPLGIGTGMGYRGYTYAIAPIQLSRSAKAESCCLDTGCSASLIDREFLKKQDPSASIRTMATPLRINGISGNQHTTSEYVVATLRILGQDEYGPAEALITRELHIVDKLEANMLIGTDIMLPEKMDILLSRKILQIGTCNVDVPVQIRVRPGYQQHLHPVHAKATTVIPPYSIAMIPIHSLSAITATTQDFLFEPRELDHASLFSHVLNSSTEGILVKNSTSTPIKIPRNTRLGHLQELGVEQGLSASAFLATEHNLATLAERPPRQKRIGWFTRTVTMLAAAYSLQAPSSSQFEGTQSSEFQLSSGPSIPETVLPNGVTIYGTQESEPVHKLTQVVSEFPKLWEDTGTFVNIPEDEWMRIPLLSDWESRIPAKGARVYPLGTEDRKEVDKTFDELHKLRRMSWSKTATPFAFPVFVVWRTLPSGKRKGRVVVDLRPLNHMALLDAYPLPLQSDIMALAHSCPYITVLDCASFFYQWRVHPSDRHKLTVVSHRGQEHFNVCVMGFKHSPAYVQHQINILLHKYPWAKAYIDDVVIASKMLEEHIQHLRTLFQLFSKMNISINPSKAFIGYLSIRILGQHVDSLGLSTDAEKLEAIAKLQFPKTLKQLEIYLGLTGYLRQYVPFYAAVSGPLQDRKNLLLRKGPTAGPQCRNFSLQTPLLNPTAAECM